QPLRFSCVSAGSKSSSWRIRPFSFSLSAMMLASVSVVGPGRLGVPLGDPARCRARYRLGPDCGGADIHESVTRGNMCVYWDYLNYYADFWMNLPGRLLDAFIALAETRRFAVAAERC